VVFAGAKALKFNLQDVDLDGDADLILHFRTEDLNLNEQSTKASLISVILLVGCPSTVRIR